jgi:sugar lactone lactonase YvrE
MCLDAEGAVWAACPYTGVCRRIAEGGAVLDEVRGSHPGVYACMLGGEDRRTLYLCTAPSHVPDETRAVHQGRIEAIRVDVPGAGLP